MCIMSERKSCNSEFLKINLIFRNSNNLTIYETKKNPKELTVLQGAAAAI